MYGFLIRVIVKIIENEAQGRKGWKMFKYFRRYILVLKSWDHPTNWDEFKCFFFFTILKIDESSSCEEILIRINVRVGRYRVWWNFEHERRHGSTVSAIDSKFIACMYVHAAAHFYVFILYRIVILSSTSLLQLFCNQITGLVEQSAFFDIPEGKWWNRSYRYLQV